MREPLRLVVLNRIIAPEPPHAVRRAGLVKADGRSYFDATGHFYPLGATLFWAARGWKFERDRLKANLAWLAGHHVDYVRVLCEVGWAGNEIDPNWPDYPQVMGELIDCCYDDYGLRVEPTLIGGGTGHDPYDVVAKLLTVGASRSEKILHWEAVNEYFDNLPDVGVVREMARRLKAGSPNLVAPSSPEGADNDLERQLVDGVGTMLTAHYPRGDGSEGEGPWHAVSQPWGGATIDLPWSHNEPRGPASSVASESDPLRLVMARVVGILCGVGAYVLHNGAGVTGQVDTARGRTANLSEMPNIDAIMTAVRGVDILLPVGLESWPKTTQHGPEAVGEQPLTADAIYTDGADHGVYRNYGALGGGQFVQLPVSVKHHVDLTARRACVATAYDPVTRAVVETRTLAAGDVWRLAGAPDGNTAYIIRGTYQ